MGKQSRMSHLVTTYHQRRCNMQFRAIRIVGLFCLISACFASAVYAIPRETIETLRQKTHVAPADLPLPSARVASRPRTLGNKSEETSPVRSQLNGRIGSGGEICPNNTYVRILIDDVEPRTDIYDIRSGDLLFSINNAKYAYFSGDSKHLVVATGKVAITRNLPDGEEGKVERLPKPANTIYYFSARHRVFAERGISVAG